MLFNIFGRMSDMTMTVAIETPPVLETEEIQDIPIDPGTIPALDQWVDEMSIELNETVCKVMAQIAIPNNYSQHDPDEFVAYQGAIERQVKLADFCLRHNLQLFPFPEELVVVQKLGMGDRLRAEGINEKQISKQLITVWNIFSQMCPVKLITGREERAEKGRIKVRPTTWELETMQVLSIDLGGGHQTLPSGAFTSTPYNPTEDNELPVVWAHELGSWLAAWSIAQMSNLSPEELVELGSLLQPQLKVEKVKDQYGNDNIGFLVGNNRGEAFLNLTTGEIVVSRGEDRQLLQSMAINGFGMKALPAMLLLALKMGSKRYDGSVADDLNQLPNLWQQDVNYGHAWEIDNPTRVIVNDTYAAMGAWVRDAERKGLGVWPFVTLKNEKHSPLLANAIKQSEGMATTDKYNMKSVGGVKATLARGIWMSKTEWHSIHDANKAAKMHNRPDQARKFLCMPTEVLDAEGQVIGEREGSAFFTYMEA